MNGAGSLGEETKYFGEKTIAALLKFKNENKEEIYKNDIPSSIDANLDKETMDFINSITSSFAPATSTLPKSSAVSTPAEVLPKTEAENIPATDTVETDIVATDSSILKEILNDDKNIVSNKRVISPDKGVAVLRTQIKKALQEFVEVKVVRAYIKVVNGINRLFACIFTKCVND